MLIHHNQTNKQILILIKNELRIQKPVTLEIAVGLCLFLLLWYFFQCQYGTIHIIKALTWCLKPQPSLYFSLLFIIVGAIILIGFTLCTVIAELLIQHNKSVMIFRSLIVLINCIPIYVYTEFWRFSYGYVSKPVFKDYFLFGVGALIFGNAIWLYIHRYLVENMKNELKQAHIVTCHAFGFSLMWGIWPKLRLLLFDIIRPILLILMGCAVFIENRFRYKSGDHYEFEGIGFLFNYDLKQMANHDYEMILGIIFSVLLFSAIVQIAITRIRYHYDPEVRYDK